MQHRSTAYLPSPALGDRRAPFRTAQLNAVGWAAVVGLCATGAATGLAAARLADASSWITVPAGAATAFAAALAADRRRWARMRTSYSWTDDPTEVRHVAGLLQRAGVDASADTDELGRPTLHYLNRDHRRVTRSFRDAGLPPPRKI